MNGIDAEKHEESENRIQIIENQGNTSKCDRVSVLTFGFTLNYPPPQRVLGWKWVGSTQKITRNLKIGPKFIETIRTIQIEIENVQISKLNPPLSASKTSFPNVWNVVLAHKSTPGVILGWKIAESTQKAPESLNRFPESFEKTLNMTNVG